MIVMASLLYAPSRRYVEPGAATIEISSISSKAFRPVLKGSVSWSVPSYSAAPGRCPSSPPVSSISNERSRPLDPSQEVAPSSAAGGCPQAPGAPRTLYRRHWSPRLMAMGSVRARARLLSLSGSGSNCAVTASNTPKFWCAGSRARSSQPAHPVDRWHHLGRH